MSKNDIELEFVQTAEAEDYELEATATVGQELSDDSATPARKKPKAEKPEEDEVKVEQKGESLKEELKTKEQKALKRLKEIKANVSEGDVAPIGTLTLRKILGGDILSTELMRRNIWLFVLVVLFMVVYVAFRYQCQQDMIQIDRMERQLKDAKYKALSSSSTLTERCRESQVLEVLRQNHDSLLHISDQPPYIINIPQSGLFSGGEE